MTWSFDLHDELRRWREGWLRIAQTMTIYDGRLFDCPPGDVDAVRDGCPPQAGSPRCDGRLYPPDV